MPINFRYSPISRDARAAGVALLDLTREYENLVVRSGLGVATLAVIGLVARGRGLLRVAHQLADTGDAAAAALAIRAITESVLTLGWFDRDHELAEAVWILDDLRTRLSHHDEVAREECRQRRRARRAGEHVEPLEPGATLGLLTRAMKRQYEKLQKEQRARVQSLPGFAQRKKRLEVKSISHMPSFADRAKVSDMPWVYSLAYRFDSNAATHPTPLTVEQFLEPTPEGDIRILTVAGGVRADPYYVAATLTWALLELTGRRIDQAPFEAGLADVRTELDRLRVLGITA